MTDIVERLREVQCETEYDAATCELAASEIARLLNLFADARTESMELRSVLRECIAMLEQLGYTPVSKRARAVLDGRKPRRTLDELRGVFEEAYKDNREPRDG